MSVRRYDYKRQGKDNMLIEKASGNLLIKSQNTNKINKLRSLIDSGKGFNGWTPEFFIKNSCNNIENIL
jgi:hypothetical protein